MKDQILWGDKPYHSLDFELKKKYGKKIAKLSLDAGFTCPTRDGTLGSRGCLFCSSRGSGDFTHGGQVQEQMKAQAGVAARKWKDCAYIAYFQSYTNTYAPVEKLTSLFDEALSFPETVGLAVATRCDCLPEAVLELLTEYNRHTYLWVELGLQTASDQTGDYLRRGFKTTKFDEAVNSLNERDIKTVAHLIAGLPQEGPEALLTTIRHINGLPVWGVKLQMLHVLKDADLSKTYEAGAFELWDRETYVETVCDALELLRPDIVIHRLTGDGKRENLVAPLWTTDKRGC